jgi:hypothetical protein
MEEKLSKSAKYKVEDFKSKIPIELADLLYIEQRNKLIPQAVKNADHEIKGLGFIKSKGERMDTWNRLYFYNMNKLWKQFEERGE